MHYREDVGMIQIVRPHGPPPLSQLAPLPSLRVQTD